MSTDKKPAKRLYTLAAAIGLALGSMGIATAASTPTPTAPESPPVATDSHSTAPADEADEVEAPGDAAVDGIDYQFDGEEVGDNGDGIPDANEADEVEAPDDANEADEVEAPDDAETDGIDHQFEGEEVGNNGDGIPDAGDANEATTNG